MKGNAAMPQPNGGGFSIFDFRFLIEPQSAFTIKNQK